MWKNRNQTNLLELLLLGFNFGRVFSDNSFDTRTTLGADAVFLGARLTELVVGMTDGAFGTTLALGRFR